MLIAVTDAKIDLLFEPDPGAVKTVLPSQMQAVIMDENAIAEIAKMDGMPDGAAEALTVKHISLDRPITDKVGEVNQMLGEEHSLIMLGELSVADGLAEMQAVRRRSLAESAQFFRFDRAGRTVRPPHFYRHFYG